jgi:hypothetical protein
MQLLFNSFLDAVGIAPADLLLLRHMDSKAKAGQTPYALWVADKSKYQQWNSNRSLKMAN